MTYAQGGLIQAADFNGFASTGSPNINNIWGVGSGSTGYGQTPVPTVSAGSIVNHTQWAALINAINNSALHQNTSMTALPVPASADEIAYLADLSTDLNLINTNRLNCRATGSDTFITGVRTAPWGVHAGIPVVTSTVSITFENADKARYFFNCGGTIRVSCARTGTPGSSADVDWTQLCTDIGTLVLPAVSTPQTIAGLACEGLTQVGGGGQAPDTYLREGFYNLTTAPTVLFRQFTGVYSTDHVTFLYSATTTAITISVVFRDNTADTSNITGSLSVTATARPSESTNIYNSWGTPTVTVSAPA